MKQKVSKTKTNKGTTRKTNNKSLLNNEFLRYCPFPDYIEPSDDEYFF